MEQTVLNPPSLVSVDHLHSSCCWSPHHQQGLLWLVSFDLNSAALSCPQRWWRHWPSLTHSSCCVTLWASRQRWVTWKRRSCQKHFGLGLLTPLWSAPGRRLQTGCSPRSTAPLLGRPLSKVTAKHSHRHCFVFQRLKRISDSHKYCLGKVRSMSLLSKSPTHSRGEVLSVQNSH